jgi:hypothetical protein
VQATLVVAVVVVKLVGQKTAKVRASQIMSMKLGQVTGTAMTVLIFLPILVAMNAQQV